MTLRDFLAAYRPVFSTPKKERFVLVKERGTSKTLMNSDLVVDWRRYNPEIYDRIIVTWAFKGNDTIIICVEQNRSGGN